MYDQREKAQRDYQWALAGARSEGLEEGLAQGREEGREKGREEGLEEGREEGLERGLERGRVEGRRQGIAEGKLVGQIQKFQELLGQRVATDEDLLSRDMQALETLLNALQQQIRNGGG